MNKTVNNLMHDWSEAAAESYSHAAEFGCSLADVDTTRTDHVLNELKKLIGGRFELPDNDWYAGIFTMIHTAQELKRVEHEARYLWGIIYEHVPEDALDVIELESIIADDFDNKYRRD